MKPPIEELNKTLEDYTATEKEIVSLQALEKLGIKVPMNEWIYVPLKYGSLFYVDMEGTDWELYAHRHWDQDGEGMIWGWEPIVDFFLESKTLTRTWYGKKRFKKIRSLNVTLLKEVLSAK